MRLGFVVGKVLQVQDLELGRPVLELSRPVATARELRSSAIPQPKPKYLGLDLPATTLLSPTCLPDQPD